ncbi:prolipoprotein diacylglyceryl transferase [Homoserinibacter sp. YIM 151385]|uniref:prolipoprotein diacylglyceryl transferase n=1 Tax=Homoserinibacter sp. YIM 151385 TaxID=2985506 RepID=UPI0022F0CE37|nr:prolipoprotein diacylglyceryl transferase [Homoserinibacter sp. YIM 151385]WBU38634.1 prolipoprotein diacylglyceryl transferase [Homoserinibacter sp. YIM 151385]
MVLPLSIPSPDPAWQVFNLGQWLRDIGLTWFGFDLNIHAYAICILAGIVAAILVANHRLSSRGAEPWVILDVAIWAVVLGIIGARAYHVLTHPGDFFGAGIDPWKVVRIWEGGNAIFGSLIGGAVGVWIGCRMSGLRFWSVADAIAPGLLLAQAMGRLGNWFNHELYGLPTDLPWGLEIESSNGAYPSGLPEGTLFHPTFLYEMIWNLVGFAILMAATYRLRLQWGKVLGLYLVWYGLGRSWFESIRIDPSELYLGIRSNVWAAVIALVLGIVILIVQSRRHPGLEPSPYVPGREWTPDAGVDSDDTYSDDEDDDSVDEGDDAAAESEEPATSGASTTR